MDGGILKTEPNGGVAYGLVGGPLSVHSIAKAFLEADFEHDPGQRPKVQAKNGDDALLETYLKHANITGYFEREARATWTLFKSLCDKPLKDCDRDDGRKLVAHFEAQELKSATIAKKVGWLNAMVHLAIKKAG